VSIAAKIGKYAYCPTHVQFFKSQGRWHARGSVTPQAGDVIFFQSGGVACHVGLVEKCAGGYVTTIEGNASGSSGLTPNGGAVVRKSYSVGTTYILGYGRPAYAAGEAARIVAVAQGQLGYLEKSRSAVQQDPTVLDKWSGGAGSDNYNKYARDIWPSLQAQPWCDIFVSWCAIQADKYAPPSSGDDGGENEEEGFPVAKTYRNGSTAEKVYADTSLTKKTGSLNPYEVCECLAIVNGRYLVKYQVDGSSAYKCGFVAYSGGVR
jgi:hypothetical protein